MIINEIYNINSLSLVCMSVTRHSAAKVFCYKLAIGKSDAVLKQTWCLSVCSSQTFADCDQGSGMKELYVRFFSFFFRQPRDWPTQYV
jgi:hypothetical protein